MCRSDDFPPYPPVVAGGHGTLLVDGQPIGDVESWETRGPSATAAAAAGDGQPHDERSAQAPHFDERRPSGATLDPLALGSFHWRGRLTRAGRIWTRSLLKRAQQ